MSLPIKTTIGVLGLSAIAIPGAWMAVTAEPISMTVSDANGKDYSGKFGEYFKYHLVGAKEGQNKSWWDWSFKHRWQADGDIEKGQEFKEITDGSSLRGKCETNYQKARKDLGDTKKSIWRYCSLEGRMPIIVKDESNDAGTIGKTNENDLVSTKDPSNSKFWEIQEKAFFKTPDGLGSKAQDSSFKALYDSKKGSLREKCQEFYGKKETDVEKDKKDAILFCSLLPKES